MSTISTSSLASNWASQIFSKLDTKNQGYIDKSTLQSAFDSLSSASSSGSSSDVDALFTRIDGDSDGKISQSELTTSLQKVADRLNSAFDQMRMNGGQGGMGGMGGPGGAGGPPPGPPPGDDTGFTKDELTQQLSEIGDTDSRRSSLISSVVNNFATADADGDGKVTRQEAMAFDQSQQASSSSATTASASSNSDSSSGSTASSSDAQVMMQIMKLMQAYGADTSNTFGLLANSLSVSA